MAALNKFWKQLSGWFRRICVGTDGLREMSAVKSRFNLCKIRVNNVNQDFPLLAPI
jgi:hypothetical protein